MSRANESVDPWSLFDVPPPEAGGIDSYLHTILKLCADWFGASVASAFLRVGDSKTHQLAAVFGASNIHSGACIREGEGIAGSALQLGMPILIEDPRNNPLLTGRAIEKRSDIASAMVVPLTSQGVAIGVLNLARGITEAPFGLEDLQLAQAVARQISLAVANCRMMGELKAASQQIQTVFECIGVAVMVVGSDGILNRNREAETLLGKGNLNAILARLPKELSEPIKSSIERGLTGIPSRDQVRSSDDQLIWSVVVAPIPGQGVTVAIEDITKSYQEGQELARVKRLAEIGQMTAALAHEIRNPLTGIRSAAQMLRLAPEQSADLAEMIEEEALKLNKLCDEFLGFARPATPALSKASLNFLANRIENFHRAEFEAKQVRFQLVENFDWQGLIDSAQMEQVLRNLLLNALQACRPGDLVTVEINRQGFMVKDTGPGIPEAVLQRLFTPFFTTKPQGTGLGLSNVRKIVEAHGGTIQVQSQPGLGTTFTVQLPIQKSKAA